MLRILARLFESSQEPCGYVSVMRKLATAPEPQVKPPRLTQPKEVKNYEQIELQEFGIRMD